MSRGIHSGTTAAGAAIAAAIAVAPGATRVQLFPYGTWTGRNGQGPYTLADRAHAEQVIATTASAQGSTRLMFDYDHQAVRAPAVAGKAIAAGWFTRLVADDAGLWAEDVEWTAAASAHIDAREYAYASPFFLYAPGGRITRVVNAGLTNTPNFDLAAIASAIAAFGAQSDMNELAAIAAALELPAETTLDQAVAAIEGLTGARSALAATASALGLDAAADGAAIASGVASLRARAEGDPDPTRFVPIAVAEDMRSQLGIINQERASAAIASAIGSGKLAPAERDWALGYFAKEGSAAFASMLGNRPVLLQPGAAARQSVDLNTVVLSAEESAVASSMGWDPAEMLEQKKRDRAAAGVN